MRSLIVFPSVLSSLIFSWLSDQLVAKRSRCALHSAGLFFTRLVRCVVPQIILLFALSISPSVQGAVSYTSSPVAGVASSGITIWLRLNSINQATGTGNFSIGKITGTFTNPGVFYVYQNGALLGSVAYPAGAASVPFSVSLPLGGTVFKAQRYDAVVLGGLDPNVVSGNVSILGQAINKPPVTSVSSVSQGVNGSVTVNFSVVDPEGTSVGADVYLSLPASASYQFLSKKSSPSYAGGNKSITYTAAEAAQFLVKGQPYTVRIDGFDTSSAMGQGYSQAFVWVGGVNQPPVTSVSSVSQGVNGSVTVNFSVVDPEGTSVGADVYLSLPASASYQFLSKKSSPSYAGGNKSITYTAAEAAQFLVKGQPYTVRIDGFDTSSAMGQGYSQAFVWVGIPVIAATAISPSSARLDVPLQFVINGTGFSAGSAVRVDDCPLNTIPAIFTTSITFSCTPILPGVKAVYVNNSVLPGISIDVDRPARLGNAASHRIPSVNGVSLWNGNVHLEATDLAVPGKGVSFALTRSYNSYSWSYEAGRGAVSDAAPWRFNWDLKLGYVGTNNLQLWVQREDGSGENFFKDVDGIWYPMDRNNFNTIKGDTPALGQTTLFTREGLKYVFQNPVLNGAGGLLIGIFDHDGNGLTIARDASARVATVTDASGRVYTFTYDASGRLFRVTDFSGRYVQYTWEVSTLPVGVRLKTVRDVLGGITTYNYALQSSPLTQNKPTDQVLLTSVIDPRLNTVRTYTYTDSVYGNWGGATFKDGLNNTWGFRYCANQFNGTCTSNVGAARGFETVTTPPLGATTTTHFDAGGRFIDQLNANAKLSRTTPTPLAGLSPRNYNLSGLPVQKQTPLGFSTNYSYTPDNLGNLASLTDATNATSTRAWSNDPVNNLPRVSQLATATGALHGFGYVGTARHVQTYTPPGLPATTFGYDAAGQVTAVTDGRNATTTQTYDANGNVTQIITPDGFVTQNTYDTLGRVLTSTDKRGGITTNTWDAAGNLISVKDALNGTVSYLYDPNGNRIQMTDARGYITIYSYDANNRLKTVSKALGATTYNYDALGRTISTVNANNHANTTTLDGVGNVLAKANALGFATQYVYDADNRVTRAIDPEGRTTDTTYDNVGRAKTVTTAAGTTSYVYDGDGRMTSSTNPRGITTNHGYDAASRLISLTDANGQITRATYDANGNVLTVTDPNNHVTSYTYDTLNRPLTRTDANGQQWVNTYDPNGNLKTRTVPGGKVTTYTYDTLDRVSRVDYPDLSVVTYTYDANGNRLSMTDSTGTTSYTYDALNRLASKTDPMGKVVSYTYDGVGNVATLGYPNGQVVRYSYDAGERLVSLTDWLNKTTSYTLNRAGQVTAALFGNNSRADMVYDPAGRMTSLINKKPDGTVISSHALTLDANGNITTSTQQLPLQPSLSNANRAFTYDVANRLATYNGTAVTHDVAGRITSLSGDSYTYNDRDQITAIAGIQIASHAYNGAGHRVMRNLNGAITRFVIDPNRSLPEVLAETDNAGTVQRNYIYGYGLVEQIDSANADHYYHFDPTGSTLALTNATGLVTDSYAYTPYGETTTNGTTLNPFRYVGKLGVMDDGNGMQFMRARYYRPDIARFMSLDGLQGAANKPQTLNRYAYATGNPVMGVDPSGLAVKSKAYELLGESYFTDGMSFSSSFFEATPKVIRKAIVGVDGRTTMGLLYKNTAVGLGAWLKNGGLVVDGLYVALAIKDGDLAATSDKLVDMIGGEVAGAACVPVSTVATVAAPALYAVCTFAGGKVVAYAIKSIPAGINIISDNVVKPAISALANTEAVRQYRDAENFLASESCLLNMEWCIRSLFGQ